MKLSVFLVSATVCGVSEAKNHVNHFGRMCFGGAGMAMNNAMARAVAAHMEECLEKFGKKFGGDDMLTYCAAYSTKVDVQSAFEDVPGLHRKWRPWKEPLAEVRLITAFLARIRHVR